MTCCRTSPVPGKPSPTTGNQLAIAAGRSYIRSCRAQGFYPGVYYPHNVHFLWYSTLFEGRSAEAWKRADVQLDLAWF